MTTIQVLLPDALLKQLDVSAKRLNVTRQRCIRDLIFALNTRVAAGELTPLQACPKALRGEEASSLYALQGNAGGEWKIVKIDPATWLLLDAPAAIAAPATPAHKW